MLIQNRSMYRIVGLCIRTGIVLDKSNLMSHKINILIKKYKYRNLIPVYGLLVRDPSIEQQGL